MTRGKYVVPEKISYAPSGKQIIYGVCPSKSNSYRIGQKGLFKSKAVKEYENSFLLQCKKRKMIEGDFDLEVDVYFPSERSDLDNSLKAILDLAAKKGLIKNDNKCKMIFARKFVDKKNPRIEFEIREV